MTRAVSHPHSSFAITSVMYASGSTPAWRDALMSVRALAMSAAPSFAIGEEVALLAELQLPI